MEPQTEIELPFYNLPDRRAFTVRRIHVSEKLTAVRLKELVRLTTQDSPGRLSKAGLVEKLHRWSSNRSHWGVPIQKRGHKGPRSSQPTNSPKSKLARRVLALALAPAPQEPSTHRSFSLLEWAKAFDCGYNKYFEIKAQYSALEASKRPPATPDLGQVQPHEPPPIESGGSQCMRLAQNQSTPSASIFGQLPGQSGMRSAASEGFNLSCPVAQPTAPLSGLVISSTSPPSVPSTLPPAPRHSKSPTTCSSTPRTVDWDKEVILHIHDGLQVRFTLGHFKNQRPPTISVKPPLEVMKRWWYKGDGSQIIIGNIPIPACHWQTLFTKTAAKRLRWWGTMRMGWKRAKDLMLACADSDIQVTKGGKDIANTRILDTYMAKKAKGQTQ